jgi:hypothetical protein
MALTFEREFTQNVSGLTGLITNTTTYGGANQDRNEAAEFRLWASLTSAAVKTYDDPDQGDPMTETEYTVSTEQSGWHQDTQVRIQLFDAGDAYSARVTSGAGVVTTHEGLFYYESTEKIYRCIADAGAGEDPEDTAFFAEVPVSELYLYLSNTNIEVSVEDHYIDAQVNVLLNNVFASHKCDCTITDLEYILGLRAKKISADSEFANENYSEGQEEIEYILNNITT